LVWYSELCFSLAFKNVGARLQSKVPSLKSIIAVFSSWTVFYCARWQKTCSEFISGTECFVFCRVKVFAPACSRQAVFCRLLTELVFPFGGRLPTAGRQVAVARTAPGSNRCPLHLVLAMIAVMLSFAE